jgi:hypothetical protein
MKNSYYMALFSVCLSALSILADPDKQATALLLAIICITGYFICDTIEKGQTD